MKADNIMYWIDKIAIKWIEWRSDYTRNEIVAVWRLASKRKFRRIRLCNKEYTHWVCVDECIFCGKHTELFRDQYSHVVDRFMESNTLEHASLLDMKGTWK